MEHNKLIPAQHNRLEPIKVESTNRLQPIPRYDEVYEEFVRDFGRLEEGQTGVNNGEVMAKMPQVDEEVARTVYCRRCKEPIEGLEFCDRCCLVDARAQSADTYRKRAQFMAGLLGDDVYGKRIEPKPSLRIEDDLLTNDRHVYRRCPGEREYRHIGTVRATDMLMDTRAQLNQRFTHILNTPWTGPLAVKHPNKIMRRLKALFTALVRIMNSLRGRA